MAGFGGSLVSNILQKASNVDEKVLDEGILKLSKRSMQLREEVLGLVREHYIDFEGCVDHTQTLERQLKEVLKDHKRLSTRVEQDIRGRVSNTADEKPKIESKLKQTQELINLVQKLVVVYTGIEHARRNTSPGKYAESAEYLNKAADSLLSLVCEAKVYRALKTELADVMADLSLKLREEWKNFLKWKPQSPPEATKQDTLTQVELRINPQCNAVELSSIVKAMQLLKSTKVWPEKVKSFGKKLFAMFIRPLIMNKSIGSIVSREGGCTILRIVPVDSCSVPELYEHLSVVLTAVSGCVEGRDWASGIGEVIVEEMNELIIAHRLATAIPRDSKELSQYGELTKCTVAFEESLVSLGLTKDSKRLSDYTKEVNSHFAAQKSQNILAQARNILMKQLHDSTIIAYDDCKTKLHSLGPVKVEKTEFSISEISDLTFRFPSCAVSNNVIEFIDLLYSTLKDCSHSPPAMALQLFTTSRKMVDLFCAVLPSFHQQLVFEIPRIAIIQHNNFLYLSHHLITLGHQFHSKLPPPLNSDVATFIDQVPLVRQLGEKALSNEMRKQSNVLIDSLKSFGSLKQLSEDDHFQLVNKAVQQALLHLVKLSQVYSDVLPIEIHRQVMGGLLGVVSTELINSVCSLEDIAMDDATAIHGLLEGVVQRGPLALTADQDHDLVDKYCKSWPKLRELAVVMDASLQKIVEQWSSGQLSSVFTAMEIRGLIKALFKNTDRRAAALAKITL